MLAMRPQPSRIQGIRVSADNPITEMPDADHIDVSSVLKGKAATGSRVTVRGWVRTRRDSKAGLSFIHVHDGSCFDPLQVVASNTLPNYESEIKKLTSGCAVTATGVLAASQGQGQAVELQAESVEVVGWVDDPEAYPIQQKKTSFEYLREVAHLRPRTNTLGAVARVRHCLSMAIHRYFHEHGFFWVHTPIVTASDAEGAGEMFRVSTLDLANLGAIPKTQDGRTDFTKDFFGKEAFLTVSGQLNVETYCLALSKVYTFGPTFRAENSNTSRHLAEFWMVEPEIAFADLAADADLAESFLKYILTALLNERGDDMKFFADRIDKDCVKRVEAFVTLAVRAHDLHRRHRRAREERQSVRVPRAVGHGHAVRARALAERGARQGAGRRHELPEGDQGVLHAHERRWEDGGGDGRAGAGHRRDHRRLAARGAARLPRSPARGDAPGSEDCTGGIATCAATEPCRTPGSASASSARSSTPRAWPISGT